MSEIRSNSSAQNSLFDKLSIVASAICAIHCVLTPVALALTSSALVFGMEAHAIHIALIAFILPMSLIALFLGCKNHRDKAVISSVLSGLAILLFAAFWGHDVLGHVGEQVATVVGSLLLVFAHWRNYRLCRQAQCEIFT